MREYYAVIERDENGELFGYVPQLRGCHTQGDDISDLLRNLDEALLLYLEANPQTKSEGEHKKTALESTRAVFVF